MAETSVLNVIVLLAFLPFWHHSRYYSLKQLPHLGHIVLFTSEQRPKLGEVTAVDPTDRHPITVALLKPDSKATSLATARYIRGQEDGQDIILQLKPLQIRTDMLKLTEEGRLTADSQSRLKELLKTKKPSKTASRSDTPRKKNRKKTQKTKPLPKKTRSAISTPSDNPRKAKPRPRVSPSPTPPIQTRYNLRKRR